MLLSSTLFYRLDDCFRYSESRQLSTDFQAIDCRILELRDSFTVHQA